MSRKRYHTAAPSQELPHAINPIDFTAARMREISFMASFHPARQPSQESASTQSTGIRRSFQTIPHHTRRRAASHNPYIMPRRLRIRMKVEPAALKPSRRRRRRPSAILAAFGRRSKHNTWLETHVWHAKRMFMTNLWGFRLGWTPTDKGVRIAWRSASHACAIHDASYLSLVEIRGTVDQITHSFLNITSPLMQPITAVLYSQYGRRGSQLLFHHQTFPHGAVAPFDFVWHPQSSPERVLWIWIHPAAHREAVAVLQQCSGISVIVRSDSVLRFSLRGPLSHAVLQRVLQPAAPDHPSARLWASLRGLSTPGALPPNCTLGLTVIDPRIRQSAMFTPRRQFTAGEEASHGARLQSVVSEPWAPWGGDALGIFDPEERVRVRGVEPTGSFQRRQRLLLWGGPLPRRSEDICPPVLLIQHPEKLGCGWDLLLPAKWGMPFWNALSSANAKPIGLREWEWLQCAAGEAVFPIDYPDTRSGQMHARELAIKSMVEHTKKPAGKRANFDHLRVSSPYEPSWTPLFGLPPDDEWLKQEVKRYVPRSFAVLRSVVEPLSRSLAARAGQHEWVPKGVDAAPNSLVRIRIIPFRRTPHPPAALYVPTADDLRASKEDPEHHHPPFEDGMAPIGYVTNGGRHFSQMHGEATGFVTLIGLRKTFVACGGKPLLMCRNVTSPVLIVTRVKVV